jgi:hypothetical protein
MPHHADQNDGSNNIKPEGGTEPDLVNSTNKSKNLLTVFQPYQ